MEPFDSRIAELEKDIARAVKRITSLDGHVPENLGQTIAKDKEVYTAKCEIKKNEELLGFNRHWKRFFEDLANGKEHRITRFN